MERCIETLSEENRYLLLQYYGAEASKGRTTKTFGRGVGNRAKCFTNKGLSHSRGPARCMAKYIEDSG